MMIAKCKYAKCKVVGCCRLDVDNRQDISVAVKSIDVYQRTYQQHMMSNEIEIYGESFGHLSSYSTLCYNCSVFASRVIC